MRNVACISDMLSQSGSVRFLLMFHCDQAHSLREHIRQLPEDLQLQAIIISPLTRTLETAIGAFGGDAWKVGDAAEPLMVAQDTIEASIGVCEALVLLLSMPVPLYMV